MNFITFDFETATAQRDSPCEIGLTIVENSQIITTKSWLIKPYYPEFDYMNVKIHGITKHDVKDAPTFDELWPELHPLLEGQFLIAHNASFDVSVLRATLLRYAVPFPTLEYGCSYIFSKNIWPDLPSYNLKSLCTMHDIDFRHHRAGDDSRATAALALKAFEATGVTCTGDFPYKLQNTVGKLFDGGYVPSRKVSQKKLKKMQ